MGWENRGVNHASVTAMNLCRYPFAWFVAVVAICLALPQRAAAVMPMPAMTAVKMLLGALPAPVTIISDDFNVGCGRLGTPWTFIDPLGDGGLRFTGGGTSNALIELSVPAGISHNVWTEGTLAPRIMQAASNIDFEIEVKFESLPMETFQGQGVMIEESPGNFLRFDVFGSGGSLNLFAASFVGGSPTILTNTGIVSAAPIYLRVLRSGDQWALSYSYDGQSWVMGADFSHVLSVSSVGVFVLNHGSTASNSPAYTAVVDYFFNNASRINPEDGGTPPVTNDPQTLALTVTGNGTVTSSPDQATYACGEVVTLTATPDPDHRFSGWSGDLVGKTNPAAITMIGDHAVVAEFVPDVPPVRWAQLSSTTGDLEAPNSGAQQTASQVFDIDGDHVNDFVIAERTRSPSVVWYRRTANGWTRHIIDEEILPIEAGGAFYDIDGDGDLDLVFCGDFRGNAIWWWENPAPDFSPTVPWTRRSIKNSGRVKHHDAAFGDVDADGQAELVVWNQGDSSLLVIEIPPDPRNHLGEWNRTVIARVSPRFEGLAITDIDLDGTVDIVGASRWYEHITGTTYAEHIIDGEPGREFTRTAVGQLIPGGRPEVVTVPGDEDGPLRWSTWDGATWITTDVDSLVIQGHSLAVEDVDGDGNLDIFVAEMGTPGHGTSATAWVYYGDGTGLFDQHIVSVGVANHESRVADLDGDGDMDILTKPFSMGAPRIDVFLNRQSPLSLDLWVRHVIDASRPWRSIFIDGADLDGDRRTDIITGAWWYQNPGTPAGVWTRRALGAPLNNMAAVADFDGDGTVDVLGTQGVGSAINARFAWAQNDGFGGFTIHENVPAAEGDFLQGVAVGRFGPLGSGPLEVALSWHMTGQGVQMLTLPSAPRTQDWTWRRVSAVSQDEQLSGGDIDLDGDIDLLLGTTWLRHDGANWTPFTLGITGAAPDRNRLADINGDGLMDAVVGFESFNVPGDLVWYEQPVDPTGIWQEHQIAALIGPMSLDVADMDGDGSLDVVVGEHNLANPDTAGLFVFANTGHQGLVWEPHTVFIGDEHHDGAIVVDIDNDGDKDILSIGWGHSRVLLYENQAKSSGTVVDVALRAVDAANPTPWAVGALPAGIASVCPGRDFFVEFWVTQVDGGAEGIANGSVDLLFDAGTVNATNIDHGSTFNNPSHPDVYAPGLVDDVGGATTLAGVAVAPNWALLARVSFSAVASGDAVFSLRPGALSFELSGGRPPLDFLTDVLLDPPYTVSVGQTGTYGDYDCNSRVDLKDFAVLLGCLAGPGTVSPSCDENADGDTDLFEFAVFQTGFTGGL